MVRSGVRERKIGQEIKSDHLKVEDLFWRAVREIFASEGNARL